MLIPIIVHDSSTIHHTGVLTGSSMTQCTPCGTAHTTPHDNTPHSPRFAYQTQGLADSFMRSREEASAEEGSPSAALEGPDPGTLQLGETLLEENGRTPSFPIKNLPIKNLRGSIWDGK